MCNSNSKLPLRREDEILRFEGEEVTAAELMRRSHDFEGSFTREQEMALRRIMPSQELH